MTRLILALLACAGIASALPAKAEVVMPGVTVANAGHSPLAMDVRYRHHRRYHHHPRA